MMIHLWRTLCLALAAVLVLAACNKENKPGTDEEQNKPLTASAIFFTGFSFTAEANAEALQGGSVKCVVDTALHTVKGATALPSALGQLKPVFAVSHPSIEVYVGEQVQVSGESVQDFTAPVVYRLKSGEVEVAYEVVLRNFTGLPVLTITTQDGAPIVNKEDWIPATATLQGMGLFPDQELSLGIRGRGNSNWGYPKKPYTLKLDKKESVMGMPKHKRWVLHANWLDRTLLRNRVAFRLGQLTGLDWTPKSEFVEVFLNGKHMGNYLLTEQVRVDPQRVDVDEATGYLFELDTYYDEVNKFKTRRFDLPVMFKNPDDELLTQEQFDYAEEFFNELETLLWEGDYARYWERMDMDSFVDWWLVHEASANAEPQHPKSSFMHMDVGGKLIAGPIWDFDWHTFAPREGMLVTNSIWYGQLFKDSAFRAKVKERWALLKPKFETVEEFIAQEAAYIEASDALNAPMWPVTQNTNEDADLSFKDAVQKMITCFHDKLAELDKFIADL